MNLKLFLSTILFTALSFTAYSQTDTTFIGRVGGSLAKQMAVQPIEKVYLQTDRSVYAYGDTIWFKGYSVSGQYHQLSSLSGVLYAELIDEQGAVKKSIKLPIISGVSCGDFVLGNLKEGNYRIRAYTNWMRNAGEDYFFSKNITLVNAITNTVFTKTQYTYSTINGQQQVSALINYADLNGVPYSGKEITYEVELGARSIVKGKGLTDEKGNMNISFINTSPGLLKAGRIVTTIKPDDKTTVTKPVLLKAASGNVDVQFFPEGGSLVIGNKTKIAFKAVGADGLGTAIKGVVTDDEGKQLTTFSSSHAGMGGFELMPKSGKTYKARVTYADGSKSILELPKASGTGYSLRIDNIGKDTLNVKVRYTAEAAQTGGMTLIAQCGGFIYYATKSKPGINAFNADIPKSIFPSDIVQFTLFSAMGEPVCERLMFIQNHDQLQLGIHSEQTYAPRQKVKIELNIRDKDGKPATGNFSVAITDESKIPVNENEETTILSNLLLTSDLKGYIENPNYYFSSDNPENQAGLDLLMLTQGYRRFEWKRVISNSFPPVVYQPEKALAISGSLKTLGGGKPVANGKVVLLTKTAGNFMLDTVADSQGQFAFKNLAFNDSVKVVIQGSTAKGKKDVRISLDSPAPQSVGENRNAPDIQVNTTESLLPFLQNSKAEHDVEVKYHFNKNAIQLKEVEIKEKQQAKKSPIDYSANLNGPGHADQVITAEDLGPQTCPKLSDCLSGLIVDAIIKNGQVLSYRTAVPAGARKQATSRSKSVQPQPVQPSSGGVQLSPMLVIIDGAPFDPTVDPKALDDLNSNDIASIEVLQPGFYTALYGARGGNGVLIVTTKRGSSGNRILADEPGIITYLPKGYYDARVFYSPRYDNPKINILIPDLRSTIYWNPNINTGNDGKASFEYFNADAKGTYRVVVEGIDVYGNLGRQVYRYKVE